MSPKEFHEAQCAIRIFEDYGMRVQNVMNCWTVHYPDDSMHGQFYDSHSMYCAAVGYKEGYTRASIREFVFADNLSDEIGDICGTQLFNSLAPIQQWSIVSSLLEKYGYKIVRKK